MARVINLDDEFIKKSKETKHYDLVMNYILKGAKEILIYGTKKNISHFEIIFKDTKKEIRLGDEKYNIFQELVFETTYIKRSFENEKSTAIIKSYELVKSKFGTEHDRFKCLVIMFKNEFKIMIRRKYFELFKLGLESKIEIIRDEETNFYIFNELEMKRGLLKNG